MKFSASAILFAAALGGVSAHPSGHAHKHMHRSLEERGSFVKAGKPAPPPEPTVKIAQVDKPKPAKTTTQAPPPPPEPTSQKPKPKPKPTGDGNSSGGGEGQGISSYTPFCGGKKAKRASLEDIAYKGNLGVPGNYGCNFMLAKSSVADEYKYNVKLINRQDKDQECVCYNKIGPDFEGINGFFKGNEALSFTLPGKATQYVVVDENTQGGCICAVGSIPTTEWGEFGSTWAEFDMGNEKNGGWSGGDASCLTASRAGLDIPGLNMCGHGTCSTIYPGGSGENAFLEGMEAEDGWGLNLPPGKVRIEVEVGYEG